MRAVKGHYNGSIVVLDEPAPVDGEAEVTVLFSDARGEDSAQPEPLRHYWNNAQSIYRQFAGAGVAVPPETQVGSAVTPSGLPEQMPSEAEWKERAARASALLRHWQSEQPSEDLATWEELKEGLDQNPVQFRELRFDE